MAAAAADKKKKTKAGKKKAKQPDAQHPFVVFRVIVCNSFYGDVVDGKDMMLPRLAGACRLAERNNAAAGHAAVEFDLPRPPHKVNEVYVTATSSAIPADGKASRETVDRLKNSLSLGLQVSGYTVRAIVHDYDTEDAKKKKQQQQASAAGGDAPSPVVAAVEAVGGGGARPAAAAAAAAAAATAAMNDT